MCTLENKTIYTLTSALLALLLFAFVVSTTVGCRSEDPATGETAHTIGLLVPLSGGAASYGENALEGVELALQHFRALHTDLVVSLVVEDSQGEPAVGPRAASKLINLDRVVGIVGCVTSDVTLAVAPLMNEAEVPIVSPGASSPNITGAGAFVLRTWPSDVLEAARMAEHLSERGISRLAILHINNEYGVAMTEALRSRIQALAPSVEIPIQESFEQGAREMRTQLQKIKDAEADALYFVGFPEAAIAFGRSYSDTGLDIPVFATSAFEDPLIVEQAGDILNGTVFTKPVTTSARMDSFRVAYNDLFNKEPGLVSDTAYDAAALILEAIASLMKRDQPVTGRAVRDYLFSVQNYDGASGTLSFDENGDVLKPIELFTLQNDEYIALTETADSNSP